VDFHNKGSYKVIDMKWWRARKKPIEILVREVNGKEEKIKTKEGVLVAKADKDYIIKGIEGELYPISKKIFHKTYEILCEVGLCDDCYDEIQSELEDEDEDEELFYCDE